MELINQRHDLKIEKYKKNLDDIKKQHVEEKLQLERNLKNTKEKYLKEIADVRRFIIITMVRSYNYFQTVKIYYFVQITMAKDNELDELRQASAKKIEEETKRVTDHAHKMIENAEAVTRETLTACRIESEERVKKVIAECDAKVSGSHVRKIPNIAH